MLGVEFEKIKNVTFLIYNKGTFFSKKDLQLHSSFKKSIRLSFNHNFRTHLPGKRERDIYNPTSQCYKECTNIIKSNVNELKKQFFKRNCSIFFT